VTVRPDGERLWLVAKYVGTRRTRVGVVATRDNTVPITDITHLRDRLTFDNGKGLKAGSGLLGNSLQTPRILAHGDVALLEEALTRGEETWHEAAALDVAMPALEIAASNLLTFRYPIGPGEQSYDLRYEAVRSTIADILNEARNADLQELRRHELDVWAGQVSTRGHYLDEMFITFSGARSFPAALLREGAMASRPSHIEMGRHPVTDGGFPEVRILNGTIAGTWTMTWPTLVALSSLYARVHGLATRANDPYKQLAAGAPEPAHFRWNLTSDRMRRVAIEAVTEDQFVTRRIPKPSDHPSVNEFGKTFGPFVFSALRECESLAKHLEIVLSNDGTLTALDTKALRSWLFFESVKLDQKEAVDEDRIGRVLGELARRRGRTPDPGLSVLMTSLIPTIGRTWTIEAIDFARSFDAYAYWGSMERVSTLCERVQRHWSEGKLDDSLLPLRTALFMMYRRAHHKASAYFTAVAPDDEEDIRFVADLLGAIKERGADV
jgi:hypothetical protein